MINSCFQVLMAQLTGQPEYRDAARDFCDFSVRRQKRTPKGLLYTDKSGTLCHAANVAFVCLQVADQSEVGDASEYRDFARDQIGYMLGDAGLFLTFFFLPQKLPAESKVSEK